MDCAAGSFFRHGDFAFTKVSRTSDICWRASQGVLVRMALDVSQYCCDYPDRRQLLPDGPVPNQLSIWARPQPLVARPEPLSIFGVFESRDLRHVVLS